MFQRSEMTKAFMEKFDIDFVPRGSDNSDRRGRNWFGHGPLEISNIYYYLLGMADKQKALQRMIVLQKLMDLVLEDLEASGVFQQMETAEQMKAVSGAWELTKMHHKTCCDHCQSQSGLFFRREIGATQQLACADCGKIDEGIVL